MPQLPLAAQPRRRFLEEVTVSLDIGTASTSIATAAYPAIPKTIAKHINNALREELEGEPVVAKFATPKKYGRKEGYTQMQNVDY